MSPLTPLASATSVFTFLLPVLCFSVVNPAVLPVCSVLAGVDQLICPQIQSLTEYIVIPLSSFG